MENAFLVGEKESGHLSGNDLLSTYCAGVRAGNKTDPDLFPRVVYIAV